MSALPSVVQFGAWIEIGLGVEHRALAGRDVHHLEVAADVVAIRRPAGLRRHDDADVAEDRLLRHLRVVRADEQADVDLVAEIDVGHLRARERLAELRDRHDERARRVRSSWMTSGALSGDSDCSVTAPGVRRNCSDVRPSPWMAASTYGRVRVERLADDPSQLAMRIDALADETPRASGR